MKNITSPNRIKMLFLAALLILGLIGCRAKVQVGSNEWNLELGSSATPQPTYTPNPTGTPRPTYTPRPPYTPNPTYTPLPPLTPATEINPVSG